MHYMDDSKMHESNLGAVVIDHRDGCLIRPINRNLFHQFAPHAVLITAVARKESVVFLRNVPPNSDRIQSMQSGLLAATTSAITQYFSVTKNQHVGDELLVAFILFG